MNKVGWKLKLRSAAQRMSASYLRGLAVAMAHFSITTDGFSMNGKDVLVVLGSALIAPFLVFVTESADIIDDPPHQ